MSGFGKPLRLDALPDALRRQICQEQARPRPTAGEPGLGKATVPPAAPKPPRGRQGPNKTEARYEREVLALQGIKAAYEGITFRLANGHRYTPDWVFCDPAATGRLICVEVMGSYKLPSYQRARMAFDQARVEWPGIIWIWATWTGKEWRTDGTTQTKGNHEKAPIH